jgi:hypothetical protein
LRPADLLAAALDGRLGPRLAVGAFASAAAADVVLLAGGVLLTRESTRSAVSRSVSRVATAARSVSRRASRSLIFVFSTLIWFNIVGVVVCMVAFIGFRSITKINLAGVYYSASSSTVECADRPPWLRISFAELPKSRRPRKSSFFWDTLALENWGYCNGWLASIKPFDDVRTPLRPNRLIGAVDQLGA